MTNNSQKIKPIFILSLPRSGSTLLQKILATHSKIKTTAEPWILLHQLYAFKKEGIVSEYMHGHLHQAVNDFCSELPNGQNDYLDGIRNLVLSLYKKTANENNIYFLDKTPRYHLIAKEIIKLFPDAKIIILWRNPLAIISSMLETWAKGKWKIYNFNVDIYYGLQNLLKVYQENKTKILTIKYENLVKNSKKEIKNIMSFLDLELEDKMLNEFNEVQFKGKMGDNIGIKKYKNIDVKSLDKWVFTYKNIYRKRWATKYIKEIGENNLLLMGYHENELLKKLNSQKKYFSKLFVDFYHTTYGHLDCFFNFWLIRKNLKKILLNKRLTVYK